MVPCRVGSGGCVARWGGVRMLLRDLRAALDTLAALAEGLAQDLTAASEAAARGAPLPPHLAERLAEYGQTRSALCRTIEALGPEGLVLEDLSGMRARVDAALHSEHVASLLRQVLRYEPAPGVVGVSMDAVRTEARRLLGLRRDDPEIDSVVAGTAPLNQLITLVEDSASLSFEEILSAQNAVQCAFGAAVAVAAGRGWLAVGDEPRDRDERVPAPCLIRDVIAVGRPPASTSPPAGDQQEEGSQPAVTAVSESRGISAHPWGSDEPTSHTGTLAQARVRDAASGDAMGPSRRTPSASAPFGTAAVSSTRSPDTLSITLVEPTFSAESLQAALACVSNPLRAWVIPAAPAGPVRRKTRTPPRVARPKGDASANRVAERHPATTHEREGGLDDSPADAYPTYGSEKLAGDPTAPAAEGPAEGCDGALDRKEECMGDRRDGEQAPGAPYAQDEGEGTPKRAPKSNEGSASGVWRLLAQRRPALAYHLARAEEASGKASPLPSGYLRMLALAPHVQRPYGELVDALEPVELGALPDQAAILVAWAATARPALMAPATGALDLLSELGIGPDLPRLAELSRILGQVAEACGGLSPEVIRGTQGLGLWRHDLVEARSAAVDAWGRLQRATMMCAQAGDLWRAWVSQGGVVHRLLQPAVEDRQAGAAEVRNLVDELRTEAGQNRAKGDAERRLGRKIHVEARALRQLRGHLQEASATASRWADVVAGRPAQPDFMPRQIDLLRQELARAGAAIRAEIEAASGMGDSPAVAGSCAMRALADLDALFRPAEIEADDPVEPSPRVALGSELLLYAEIDLDDEWMPEQPPARVAEILLTDSPNRGWTEAFSRRLDRHDLDGCQRIVEVLHAADDPVAEGLRQRCERELASHRRWLVSELDHVSDLLDDAALHQLISDTERSAFAQSLVSMRAQVDEVRRFGDAASQIRALSQHLWDVRQTLIETRKRELDAELRDLRPPGDEAAVAQVQSAIGSGDVVAATELLGRLRAGEPLSSPAGRESAFGTFYPDALHRIDREMQAAGTYGAILERLTAGETVAGLTLAGDPTAVESGSELIDVWFRIKGSKHVLEGAIQRVLRALGFAIQSLKLEQTLGVSAEVLLQSETISDRRICSVAAFGSQVEGRYRFLCTWAASPDEIRDTGAAHF